ncbi:MAG: YciI family protein [Bacteroidales bacterium]
MKQGDKLFVRIDYKNNGTERTEQDFQNHIDYLKGVASERYIVGGGFANINSGMVVFKAKDLEEAKTITEQDPIIAKGFYRYGLFEWDLVIVSDKE